ncbi:hypothetical protein ACLOJK_020863 [Asimina triloba]
MRADYCRMDGYGAVSLDCDNLYRDTCASDRGQLTLKKNSKILAVARVKTEVERRINKKKTAVYHPCTSLRDSVEDN